MARFDAADPFLLDERSRRRRTSARSEDPRDALRWGERQQDRWLERWIRSTEDLARLQYSHHIVDAVIDEIDGRQIRIGDQWLTDYASCNYLGLDLDEEIIEAVPEYLCRWGTHPSWSRLLGSPVLYEEIEDKLAALLGCEDSLVLPPIRPAGRPMAGPARRSASGRTSAR
jgi:7-keto-8-aminopelargonate synthetase-like enzyme